VLFVISFLFPIIIVFLGRIVIIIFHNILFHHQFHPVMSKLDVLCFIQASDTPETLPVLSTREQHVTVDRPRQVDWQWVIPIKVEMTPSVFTAYCCENFRKTQETY